MDLTEQVAIVTRITEDGEATAVNIASALLIGWISMQPAADRRSILQRFMEVVLADSDCWDVDASTGRFVSLMTLGFVR